MLKETKEMIEKYYRDTITSQKLIAHIDKFENSKYKEIYDEYFDIKEEKYCSICDAKMNYTGFKKGYICHKSCETKKYVNSLTDYEIINIVKDNFSEQGGYTKQFGLEFKKFENRLSKLYFNSVGPELKYCVINNIREKPKCEICGDECHFSRTKYSYARGCNINHIMLLETHKWSNESKEKMVEKLKQTRAAKILENPNYFKRIGEKVSLKIKSFSKQKMINIKIKRKETNLKTYGVENVSQNEDIKNKKKQTLFDNYGITSVWSWKHIIEKIKETNIKNGRWIPDSERTFAELYYKSVWKHTKSQILSKLDNFEKRGRLDLNPDAFHLDHKFSIKEGFNNCILPSYIGNINNLEMIPARENCSKGANCSIDLNELFSIVS